MKTILIFSNPFGYGPGGKAISIAKYISESSSHVKVVLCGNSHFRQMATGIDCKCIFREMDERNENEILKILKSIKGEKYVISSQNRFAIKAAHENGIQCAFLDGLSWFWTRIPDDHFLADIIFWLNYPGIVNKIPQQFKDKIYVVHGITEKIAATEVRDKKGILMYIGGCKNPLTLLPLNYLDLVAKLMSSIDTTHTNIKLVSDFDSLAHLREVPSLLGITKKYSHSEFLSELATTNKFITNGGQTATIEAAGMGTSTSFFLPVNLSQYALIEKLSNSGSFPSIVWRDYVKLPADILDYSEKDAITYFDAQSREILKDKERFKLLRDRFCTILSLQNDEVQQKSFLSDVGSTGAADVYRILKDKWGLS